MFKYNPEISFGNILTSLSILIGLGTFAYTENQKRLQAVAAFESEMRDLIGRGEGAAVRLDNELKTFFLAAEPLFVTTSELAINGEGTSRERFAQARDFLWREITVLRVDMERRILGAEALPGGLAAAGADYHETYTAFQRDHADLRTAAYSALQSALQNALFDSFQTATQTAEIGDALREAHGQVRAEWLTRSGAAREAVLSTLSSP